ncbi:MAG: ATP-dependent DNA helicase [Pseudomonadota bacterium]
MALGYTHRVSVGELVTFVERKGDINFRFSSRSSATAGIRGHQRIQRRRGDGYVAEKEVRTVISFAGGELLVAGRADGYFPDVVPLLVEEIKTVRADATRLPESVTSLHWGQGMIYGYLLACEHEAQEVCIQLTYLQLDDDSEHTLERYFRVTELKAYFEGVVFRYLEWLSAVLRWRTERDITIGTLPFPYDEYRPGQRDLAVAAYRALQQGTRLVLQAPTGLGKTMAVLFPAVKSMRELGYDRVFYLTAKGSGAHLAREAVAAMRARGLVLRDITLTAKEKACLSPGSPCDAEHCTYADGYYDRIGDVMQAAFTAEACLDREAIEVLARRHRLCPFELSLDLTRLADVVICDYNYVFDPSVYLRRFFDEEQGRYAFLIDESHNLVDRGREMYSIRLKRVAVTELRRALRDEAPLIASRLGKVNTALLGLRRQHREALDAAGYVRFDEVPETLLRALRRFCEAAEAELQEKQLGASSGLVTLYFDALRFLRLAEAFDEHFACLMTSEQGGIWVKILNLDPSPGLNAGMQRANGVVLFSATLAPRPYFQRLMGLDSDTPWYRSASPFEPQNLGVFTVPFISTAWRDRSASLYALVDVINAVVSGRTGNYLVFFPSYAYLEQVYEKFAERYPGYETQRQDKGMSQADRDNFLAGYETTGRATSLVGFAVMGGVFGEGVDLVGSRLIGVIVVGVGLPQVSVELDLVRDHFEPEGRGFEYAYQYPGLNRVLQTAGRVIRSESDRGVVCLVDRRFATARYASLLPAEWRVTRTETRQALTSAITSFWNAARDAQ